MGASIAILEFESTKVSHQLKKKKKKKLVILSQNLLKICSFWPLSIPIDPVELYFPILVQPLLARSIIPIFTIF